VAEQKGLTNVDQAILLTLCAWNRRNRYAKKATKKNLVQRTTKIRARDEMNKGILF
jgi:hypothetical protein